MASSESPRAIDQTALMRTVARLSPGDFAQIVVSIKGAARHISRHGTVPEQAAELLRWVESSTGPGLEAVQQALEQLAPGSTEKGDKAPAGLLIGTAIALVAGITICIAIFRPSPPPEPPVTKTSPLDEANKKDGRTLWVANEPYKAKFIKQADGTWKSSDDGGVPRQDWRVTDITPSEIRLESSNKAGKIYGVLTATNHEYWMDLTPKTTYPGRFRGETLWMANEPYKTKFVKQADGTWKSSDDGGDPRQDWRVTDITPSEILLESRNEGGPVYGKLTATAHEYWTDLTPRTTYPGRFIR